MKTWNDWSDLGVNHKVAEVLGKKVVQHSMMFEGKVWVIEGDNGIERLPDYCNSWHDMGKIIVANRIMVLPYQDESQGWFSTTDSSFFVDDNNPLRATAIVFLMMNGVEENEE